MPILSNQSLTSRAPFPIRVLQFGGGNFIRAFSDWMIDHLNEKTDFNAGVAIVKPTERGDYEALRKQDGLFHVLSKGIKDGVYQEERRLVQCVQQIIHPYKEWDLFLKTAENPSIRFVFSNTTEAGIKFNPADQFTQQPPKEFPAKLLLWLHHRYTFFKGDHSKNCIFLPLELVPENGQLLKQCLLKYAHHWDLETGFIDFVEQQIYCNSLVDRIVAGYSATEAAKVEQELSLKDELLVSGEHYHSWVIQAPKQVREELPAHKTDLNIQFVDDLEKYRTIKVRLLNGAHTSLVPIGFLRGHKTVLEAMQDQALKAYLMAELKEEIIPSLNYDPLELQAYASDVMDRFCNPSLQHYLLDISLNSTTKFVTRLLPSLLGYQEKKGTLPPRIVFALTALLRFYQGDWRGESIPLKDNPAHLQFFKETWQIHHQQLDILVSTLLSNQQIWGKDLNEIPGLHHRVTQQLKDFEQHLDQLAVEKL